MFQKKMFSTDVQQVSWQMTVVEGGPVKILKENDFFGMFMFFFIFVTKLTNFDIFVNINKFLDIWSFNFPYVGSRKS